MATRIFAEFNGVTNDEIIRIKKNRIYYETFLKNAQIYVIDTPKWLMTYNILKRNRSAEKVMSLKYARNLYDFYY